MKLFTYAKVAGGASNALAEAKGKTGSHHIAGGTNLIDLMKENVMAPAHLVDINALELNQIE